MRHRVDKKKLGRDSEHRKALLSNLVRELILHKRIKTTLPKAKEASRLAEKMVTFAKKGDVHSRRQVFQILHSREIVKTLFDEIAPVYADRKGGYTRILKLGHRPDGAKVALFEFVDKEKIGTVSENIVDTEQQTIEEPANA
ncbi:50S ribosomal protein L17 [bacterium]|nr:50S ribosomal protein L17 [bacterium]